MAEELDVAIVLVVHMNKTTAVSTPGYRVAGSIAFPAAARSVLFLGQDPEDPDGPGRVLAHEKSNLGPKAPALRLRLEGRDVPLANGELIHTSGIAWLGEAHGVTTADLICPPGAAGDASDDVAEAKDRLRDLLRSGRMLADDVKAKLKGAGIPERIWKIAKARLGITRHTGGVVKDGFSGGWYWQLPPEDERRDGNPSSPSVFGRNGQTPAQDAQPRDQDGQHREDGHGLADLSLFEGQDAIRLALDLTEREPGEEG
jgi:hypothetical protein